MALQCDVAQHIVCAGIVWIYLQLCLKLRQRLRKAGVAVAFEVSHCRKVVGHIDLVIPLNGLA